MGVTWYLNCTLCGRGEIVARRPTAKERGDRRKEKPNLSDYYAFPYNVGGYPDLTHR